MKTSYKLLSISTLALTTLIAGPTMASAEASGSSQKAQDEITLNEARTGETETRRVIRHQHRAGGGSPRTLHVEAATSLDQPVHSDDCVRVRVGPRSRNQFIHRTAETAE